MHLVTESQANAACSMGISRSKLAIASRRLGQAACRWHAHLSTAVDLAHDLVMRESVAGQDAEKVTADDQPHDQRMGSLGHGGFYA